MVEREDFANLLSSAVLVMGGTVLSSVSGLIERIIIGRSLGSETYGVVSVCIAALTLVSTFAIFGLSQGIPRYIPRFNSKNRKNSVWASGFLITSVISVIAATIGVLFSREISNWIFNVPLYANIITIFAISVPFLSLFRIGVGGIRGMENTIYRTYSQDITYPLVRICILIALLSLGYGASSSAISYLCGSLAAFLVAHYLLNRILPLSMPRELEIRQLLTFSAPLIVSTTMAILLTRADTIMLGYFKTAKAAGIYSAAYPLAAGLQLVLTAFGFLYLPLASRFDSQGEHGEIETVYELTTKWVYIITFPAFCLFVFFPEETIRLFWGPEYQSASTALIVLSAGFFSSSLVGRNRETLSAMGETRLVMYANGIALVTNLILNIVLIPQYGVLGASVASAISFLLLNIFIYLTLRFKFGISPFSIEFKKSLVAVPLVIIPILFYLTRLKIYSVYAVPTILIVIGIATLVVVYLVGSFQTEDMVIVDYVDTHIPFVGSWIRMHLQDK